MVKYRVYGEYGPLGSMCIEQVIDAPSADGAEEEFIRIIQEEYPIEWKYMGRSNVHVECAE